MTAKSEVEDFDELDVLICKMYNEETRKACYSCNEDDGIPENCVVEKVKEIIQQALTSERERIVRGIEGLEVKTEHIFNKSFDFISKQEAIDIVRGVK